MDKKFIILYIHMYNSIIYHRIQWKCLHGNVQKTIVLYVLPVLILSEISYVLWISKLPASDASLRVLSESEEK